MTTEIYFKNLICPSSLLMIAGWYLVYKVIRMVVPKPTTFETPDKPGAKQRQIGDYYNCWLSLIHAILMLLMASIALLTTEDLTWGRIATPWQFLTCQLSFNYFLVDSYIGMFELKTMDMMMGVHHLIMLSACGHCVLL